MTTAEQSPGPDEHDIHPDVVLMDDLSKELDHRETADPIENSPHIADEHNLARSAQIMTAQYEEEIRREEERLVDEQSREARARYQASMLGRLAAWVTRRSNKGE